MSVSSFVSSDEGKKSKLSRQEVYDSIILGQQVLDNEVFENVVTYNPLGKMEIKPLKDSTLRDWNTYQESLDV